MERASLPRIGFCRRSARERVFETAGLEGLSSHHRKETNRLHKDPEKWKMWTEILLETCTHPAVVGSAEHFLLVCKKRG